MSKIARPAAFAAIQAEVGQRMRIARELVTENRAEFARLCGVDASTLTKIENGERAASLFLVREYATRLRVTADFLLFGTLAGIAPDVRRRLIKQHAGLIQRNKEMRRLN